MRDYVIFTDSGCDVPEGVLGEWGVLQIDLLFRIDGTEKEFKQSDMPVKGFYDSMRAGTVFRTAAANSDCLKKAFEPVIRKGLDVLYVCFSSGLSGTADTAKLAAEELMKAHPEAKVKVVDTLCASGGEGLILYHAVTAKKNGSGIDETAVRVLELRPRLCHWFTVDDLVYLRRGGRVGAAAAFFGGILNIKPVLHVDNDGHLIPMFKVRGRTNSIKGIMKKYRETAMDPAHGVYFISHGDCLEDAKKLEDMIIREYGNKAALITDIGPVIGAHSGPGTLALFYLGRER